MDFQVREEREEKLAGYHRIVRLLILLIVLPGVVLAGFLFFGELGKVKEPEKRTEEKDETQWIEVKLPKAEDVQGQETATGTAPEADVEAKTGEETGKTPDEVMVDVMVGLKGVVDRAPLEEGPFHWLLGKASETYGQVGLLEHRAPMTKVESLYERPAEFRGKPVKLMGKVERISVEAVPKGPHGIKYIQSGSLSVGGEQLVSFFIPRTEPAYQVGDVVVMYGLFFKIEQYLDMKDREETAPAVVVTAVEPVSGASVQGEPGTKGGTLKPDGMGAGKKKDDGFRQLKVMMFIVVGLLVVYAMLWVYRRKKQGEHYERMEKWRRNRRLVQSSEDEGPGKDEGRPDE